MSISWFLVIAVPRLFLYFVTSLVGSRLTPKLSCSIGKSLLKGGLFRDKYTQDLTTHFALMGFLIILNKSMPCRII